MRESFFRTRSLKMTKNPPKNKRAEIARKRRSDREIQQIQELLLRKRRGHVRTLRKCCTLKILNILKYITFYLFIILFRFSNIAGAFCRIF